MPNTQISNLPSFTGNANGSYLIINDSGDTFTYKTTLENLLLNYTTPQLNTLIDFWNTYVTGAYNIDGSGILYWIASPGSGYRYPAYSTSVQVTYTGKLMNNTVFDNQSTPFTIPLSGTILAWQIMLQKITSTGGRILFAAPSFYCYGIDGGGGIPPNSPLFFDVTLYNVT
jgi:hypothetical protein